LSRIAEQFKAHLIKFDTKNEDLAKSSLVYEQKLEALTEELRLGVQDLESRMEEKYSNESTKISRV